MRSWIMLLFVASLLQASGFQERSPYNDHQFAAKPQKEKKSKFKQTRVEGEVFSIHCHKGGCDVKVRNRKQLMTLHFNNPNEIGRLKRGMYLESSCRAASVYDYDNCRTIDYYRPRHEQRHGDFKEKPKFQQKGFQ